MTWQRNKLIKLQNPLNEKHTKKSALSNLRREHLQMRAHSYAWSLPVTWQRWRSYHL